MILNGSGNFVLKIQNCLTFLTFARQFQDKEATIFILDVGKDSVVQKSGTNDNTFFDTAKEWILKHLQVKVDDYPFSICPNRCSFNLMPLPRL
jgi:hypothetical protein